MDSQVLFAKVLSFTRVMRTSPTTLVKLPVNVIFYVLGIVARIVHLDLRLNSALEDQIKGSLKILLSRQKKTIYPDPNESTLLTLPLSTLTLRTSALAEAVGESPRDGTYTAIARGMKTISSELDRHSTDAAEQPNLIT
jgi:hypothetical protein